MDWKKIILICAVLGISCFITSVGDTGIVDDYDNDTWVNTWFTSHGYLPKAAPVYGTISNGGVVEHPYVVPSGKTRIDVSLEWNRANTQNELTMKIVTPTLDTYGPFSDIQDGRVDGKISISTMNNIRAGVWNVIVLGTSVSGTQSYTLVFNAI